MAKLAGLGIGKTWFLFQFVRPLGPGIQTNFTSYLFPAFLCLLVLILQWPDVSAISLHSFLRLL